VNTKELILSFVNYNHWANGKLSDWLTGLDSELLYRQISSSFASIELTVQHMQESQQFWLGIITKKGIPLTNETDAAATNFNLLLAGSRRLADAVGGFTEQELLETVASTDMLQSRCAFILHVINHNSYHRGQIVTICRQLGVVDNIPALDFEVFLWSSQ
jgi:uncharacterized damage-inducible protein DinB